MAIIYKPTVITWDFNVQNKVGIVENSSYIFMDYLKLARP
jgi:hypothetical protein